MLEMVVTTVNTCITLPSAYNKPTPINNKAQEYIKPLRGTPLLDNLPNAFGANFLSAKPYNMRPVEYIPLLAEDKAEVNTTKLIKAAAAPIPIKVNMFTNGLLSGATELQGVTVMMTIKANT